ncbi:nucleotide-diphospho-sugar transferase [Corynespora cassiicola Philippines]|uniref:glycogenin glucosyltransferase n=1 Tax=Corynespora cassiicola Philippines TaxID=1448308 RepID=A0A2T2NQF4_CORCC|nr:nucleotide-diphospho-sugar transferase [Corynespora cassiicola Philippines]
MASQPEDVYATLLLSDSYLPGAAVLAHSLRDGGTTRKLAALVTVETLSADTITQLRALYDYVIPVAPLRNPNPANLFLMGRPDLSYAFTKIALWRQTQFRKIVYLDADVVALRSLDELFDIDAPFAAAPDVGWPDAFNSGVMVLTPDMGEYWALQTMAAAGDSFDGADQGLLNQYFENRNWHRLKFTYNVTPNAQYQWEPAYRYYKRDISAVHFIGKNKPWSTGRTGPAGSGVYNELLARWWAVYDRHLKAPAAPRVGQPQATVQQHVQGETTSTDFGTSSIQQLAPEQPDLVEPEAPTTTTEVPLSEPGEVVENIDQGVVEPTPTAEQRRFSAPHMEWDATRSEPPVESKPEAANFPTETYEFSASHELFKAPQEYPEPPRDMWYSVPETKPAPAAPPKPIFPWESQPDRPKATRVFAEDLPSPTPTPAPEPANSSPTQHFAVVHYEEGDSEAKGAGEAPIASPPGISSPKTADESWQEFQATNVNAWDSVPGIDTYVRAVMQAQGQHSKQKAVQSFQQAATEVEEIMSPQISRKERRESLIITDFPSAVERPSLPVTPAPVRRPTFWGEERDEAGELPAAEGVPNQADWVCPSCGFSSMNASDFRRNKRESIDSTATAIATPAPSTDVTAEVQEPAPSKASPTPSPLKSPVESTFGPESPSKMAPVERAPSPPRTHPRSGVNARGTPLASLTDPSLFEKPPPSPEASEPLPESPTSASTSASAPASDAPVTASSA